MGFLNIPLNVDLISRTYILFNIILLHKAIHEIF